MPATKTPARSQDAIMREIIAKLADLRGGVHGDDLLKRNTTGEISIPENMSLDELIVTVQRIKRAQMETVGVERTFRYRPFDGARATSLVLHEVFGSVMGKTQYSFFGKTPPEMHSVDVALGQTEQVPWGQLQLDARFGEDSYLVLGQTKHPEWGRVFTITAYVPKMFATAIEGFYDLVEQKLITDSIYNGKAITASETPTFIDLSAVDFDDVVYSEDVKEALEAYVWLDLRYPQSLRDLNQLGKRLTVLYGTFGTGKTLAAHLTAWLTQHGPEPVSFYMVRPGLDSWRYAIQMASLGGGRAIIFIEDIDTVFDPKNPTELSAILDAMDGLLNKGSQVSMIATTNHIELIPRSMLRLGRTDAIIEIGNLDVAGLTRLTRRVLGDLLAPDVDFDRFYEATKDFTPSSVKEALIRSSRHSMRRNKGAVGQINTDDLVRAAKTLYRQLELMAEAPDRPAPESFRDSWASLIHEQVDQVVEHRVHGASIVDDDGDTRGVIHTN